MESMSPSAGSDPKPESASNTPTASSTGGNTPQQTIATIQPNQAAQLAQRFTNEIELAKAAGSDVEKAKQHYSKAESIKRILIQYRAQQKAKDPKSSASASPSPSAVQSPIPLPATTNSTPTQSPLPLASTNQSPAPSRPQTPSGESSLNTKAVTVELFNQVKVSLSDLLKKIQNLEESKAKEVDPQKIEETNNELTKIRPKLAQFQKIAVYMKNQLIQQGKLSANGGPISTQLGQTSSVNTSSTVSNSSGSTTNSAASTNVTTGENTASQPPSNNFVNTTDTPSSVPAANNTGKIISAGSTINSTNPTLNSTPKLPVNTNTAPFTRAIPPTGSFSNQSNLHETAPGPNSFSSASTLPSMSTMGRAVPPIVSATSSNNLRTGPINVRSQMGNGAPRPQLGMHAATDFNSYSTLNSLHNTTPTNIPDNGGRVLTKRKLVDLVNNIGMEEGDAKTTMDNDVEEILLDLADDFISSVTSFACQIAKHRKVDKVDIRDFQLHLERNWGIRAPPYTSDEVKVAKKWQPNQEYTAKVAEIESVQTANGSSNDFSRNNKKHKDFTN
ncbi:TFIID subunit (TBP-associated factor) [Scheffersomyces xylosifermentans]|uniref:TFIID subunit (TBP-associated factor) n=1 Tax=Scheffersomyces xylosifermentans TaxID=1304137 RepID=UPI00315CA858